MIRDEHLDDAIRRGIVSAEQAAALRALASGASDAAVADAALPDPDDERFRLIGGFNDVFVTIGVGLLASALIGLAVSLGLGVWFTIVALISSWALAEVFTARMRLALPSIALAVMFAVSGGHLAASLGELLTKSGTLPPVSGLEFMLVGLGGALAAAAHERRFGVPIDTALVAAGVIAVLAGALTVIAPEFTRENSSLLVALYGLAVFAAALRFDARDPQRVTKSADIAFWLHMVASPMIVHAMMPMLFGSEIGPFQAILMLMVFAVLGLIAIVIDRRALLVSGLTYAGVALSYLLSQGVERGMGIALALLGLAAIVLGLSLGWRSLRRTIVPLLPLDRVRRYVPPTI